MDREEVSVENSSIQSTEEAPKKKRKLSGYKIVLIIISILLLLAVILTASGLFYIKKNFNYNYNEIPKEPESLGFEEVKEDNIINIALFGLDTKNPKSFKGRSDSIMILSLNTTDNKIKLISVLRDSFVPIEDGDRVKYSKINSAYASGGPQLAIRTLNNVYGLDISEYATVNLFGMADIIDIMGGIEVEIIESELSYVNKSIREQCRLLGKNDADYQLKNSGKQHLNGMQATAYARVRYAPNVQGTSNDYGRTDRQRYVLSQLLKKVSASDKAQYINLIKTLSPYCETSLSYTELLSLAVDVLLEPNTFEESRVPSTEYTMRAPKTNAGAIVYYDLDFAANIIHAFIYEDILPKTFIEANGIEKNDWYKNGYKKPVIISHKERQEAKESAINSQNTPASSSSAQ